MSENQNIPPADDSQAPPIETPPPSGLPSREAVAAWLEKEGYTAYPADDPRWVHFNTPPQQAQVVEPPPSSALEYDFTDPEAVSKIVEEKTKGLTPAIAAEVTKSIMAQLSPLLSGIAQTQVTQGLRPEAAPYQAEILKELGFTPLQVAQDPKVARLVNEAAESRAIKAGKIGPSILFPNEPPYGNVPAPQSSQDAVELRARVEDYQGRKLTDEEFAPYLKDAGLMEVGE